MTSWANSTQRREWLLSPEALAARRAASLPPPTHPATPDDLLLLTRYYAAKAATIAATLQLPPKVFRCAALLLARCALHPPLALALDARTAMLACLYVASKAEERYVSADALGACVGGTGAAAAILAAEPHVLAAVSFCLVTHHPHRVAAGVVAAAGQVLRAQRGGDEGATSLPPGGDALLSSALKACDDLVIHGDGPLTQPPGWLGLAAVRWATHVAKQKPRDAGFDPQQWGAAVDAAFAEQVAAEGGRAALGGAERAIAVAVDAARRPLPEEDAKAADRRVREWRAARRAAAGGGQTKDATKDTHE